MSILAETLTERIRPAAVDALSRCAAALRLPASKLGRGRHLDQELARGSHPFSRSRRYRVYVPANHDPRRPTPLLMVLHGCRQSHLDIQTIAAFDAIADRERFIVVYPSITSYIGLRNLNCWGWWLRGHRERGRGEVEDLARIARHLTETMNLDPDRRYICGLSSGAGMSVASLIAANDTWSAGASVAGVAYGEGPRAVRLSRHLAIRHRPMSSLMHCVRSQLGTAKPPPLLIVQSDADLVVAPDCARRLADQWLKASDLPEEADATFEGGARGKHYRLQSHVDAAEGIQLLHMNIDRIAHGWFGGVAGTFSTPAAPNLSELIWSFLSRQR